MSSNNEAKTTSLVLVQGFAGRCDLMSLQVAVKSGTAGWVVLVDRANSTVTGDVPQPGTYWQIPAATATQIDFTPDEPLRFTQGCWVAFSTVEPPGAIALPGAARITVRMRVNKV